MNNFDKFQILQITMDSPTFGSSHRNKNMLKITSNYEKKDTSSENIPFTYQVIASLAVKKNFNKLFTALNHIILNKKRHSFVKIHLPARTGLLTFSQLNQSQAEVILQVEKRMNIIFNLIKFYMQKNKIRAWREMKNFNNLKASSDSHKSNTANYNYDQKAEGKLIPQKAQKKENWKENSTSNLPDLTFENKKLKNEIQKEQMYQESFISKMKTLLETHQKQASKLNIKKKK